MTRLQRASRRNGRRRDRRTLEEHEAAAASATRLLPSHSRRPALWLSFAMVWCTALRADEPSFQLDVMPILSKAGCNGGGCHGALAGKAGFRLSLFGYDPQSDYLAITRDARGSSTQHGATNFFAVHQDPETLAENVSQAFLALSINCAKCHNHPLEKWTNDQYYAFANLFSRVRAKGWGGDSRNGDGVRTLYVESRGELLQPKTGRPQPPAPLDGEPLPLDDAGDRREPLARWLTAPENPYFTRAIVNRVWANFFGLGLVEPVDDLRTSNPASNEQLLDALCAFTIEHRYDLKQLMRLILLSETYARSSMPLPENRDDLRWFARAYPKRLMAEVLSDAIADVTGVRDRYTETVLADGSTQKLEGYDDDTRALELGDSSVKNYFLDTFGRNAREITCECERSSQPSLVQVLHLSNGSTLNGKLAAKEGRVTQILATDPAPATLVEDAWIITLSRKPTDAERKPFEDMLSKAAPEEKRQIVEDMYWSLLTSREFLFRH